MSAPAAGTPVLWEVECLFTYNPSGMKKINLFAFFQFGLVIHPIMNIPAGSSVNEWSVRLLSAASWIETTCDNPVLPLRVSRNSGKEAVQAIRALAEKAPDYVMRSEDTMSVLVPLLDFQAVFREELNITDAYAVSQKAHFSTTTLIEKGDLMFPPEIHAKLPPEAIHDIQQGAKCFAFELPTAAGFHFLRALEAVIHSFYDELSDNAPRPERSAMGIYIDELTKLNVQPELAAILKQIKDLHRNPIAHPDQTLDMVEAQMLMGIMQSAIFSMVKIVQARELKKMAATLIPEGLINSLMNSGALPEPIAPPSIP